MNILIATTLQSTNNDLIFAITISIVITIATLFFFHVIENEYDNDSDYKRFKHSFKEFQNKN